MLTQEYLKQRLEYDPETGIFIWKYNPLSTKTRNTRFAGKVAGSIRRDESRPRHDYWSININGMHCTAHRLAWLYVTGYLPKRLDHKDGDGLNNRFDNLREATHSQNSANTYNKETGIRETDHGYQARIQIDGISKCLGTFTTKEEAQLVYIEASNTHFGEFSRFQRQ